MLRHLWKWLVGGAAAALIFHRQESQQFALGLLVAVLSAMNPYAASGAAVGCCFYLAYPSASKGMQRLLYVLFSWGVGYASGVFFYGDGPPYSQKGMLVASVVAAVAVLVFVAWGSIIKRDGNLPPWVQSLLDVVFPFRKRGNDDAG